MIFEFPILNDKTCALPIYIKEIGYLENQDHIIRTNMYDNNQILICSHGKGKLIIDNKSYTITDKNIFFTEKYIPHEYFAIEEPWTISWIVFDGNFVDELLNQLKLSRYEVFEKNTLNVISNLFDEVLSVLKSNNPKKHIECSILIYTLIAKLSYFKRLNTSSNSKTKKNITFDKILEYLQKNYSKDISLTDISDNLDLSPYYICRVFKEFNDTNLITYLNQYRISMAKKFLLQSPLNNVKDISNKVGFKDSSYFIYLFKKSEGLTPGEFRQLHGF